MTPMPQRSIRKIIGREHQPSDQLLERVLADLRKSGSAGKPKAWWLRPALVGTFIFILVFSMGFFTARRLFPGPADNHQLVKFSYYAPQAETVALAGDFTEWQDVPFILDPESGNWEVEVSLKKKSRYKYIFIIDREKVITDPSARLRIRDGFGRYNSVLSI